MDGDIIISDDLQVEPGKPPRPTSPARPPPPRPASPRDPQGGVIVPDITPPLGAAPSEVS